MKRLPLFVALFLILTIGGFGAWSYYMNPSAGLISAFWPEFRSEPGKMPIPGKMPAPQSRATPEADSGFEPRAEVRSHKFMVATANPLASAAGKLILKKGGSALDAAIAVQLVLNVVEPQSSGIGGGAFLLHWSGADKKLQSYDGRERAPLAANERHFLREDGSALGFGEAVRSGRSIGVPGVLMMLFEAHKQHGKLPWSDLFQPAIELCEAGFAVSPRLNKLLTSKGVEFFNDAAQSLFFDEALAPLAVGALLKNPKLAESFRVIASKGVAGFYQGQLAEDIVATAGKAPVTASLMTLDDLSSYRSVERGPVCGTYISYNICGMGAPSSGGTTVAMIMKLIEPFDLGKVPNFTAMHIVAEAEKLAFADRNFYMADPDFVPQPRGFLSTDYLKERRELISTVVSMEKAEAGAVPLAEKALLGKDATVELGGTSHVSIIDAVGNVVSMTSSIEGAFGSGQMVGGFLLNNQLTDFSFKPADEEGKVIANRIEPGKRPRSSMSPTIAFDQQGRPRIIVGSPGGSRIILYVVKALVGHINWGMGPQEAVSLINFGSRNGPFELEKMPAASLYDGELVALGQTVKPSVMTSGTQMIVINYPKADGTVPQKDETDTLLLGGADPRREGAVIGE